MDAPLNCPSTHQNLFFNCFFFLVPTTAALCYSLWRNRVNGELFVVYTEQGSTVQARVVGKQCTIVEEFRSVPIHMLEDSWESQACELAPFFLRVQYATKESSVAIDKRVEVLEPRYKHTAVGETIELQYIPGHDRSAIVVSEWHSSHGVSLVVFSAFLCLLATGLCAMNACVTFGWAILIGIQIGTFLLVWVHLEYSRKDQVWSKFLNPPAPETESQHLVGGNAV